jgi:hypothetical protein
MNILPDSRPSRALWLMFAVSAVWILYEFGSHYGACRVDGTGKIGCLLIAIVSSLFEIVVLIVSTIWKVLMLVLP